MIVLNYSSIPLPCFFSVFVIYDRKILSGKFQKEFISFKLYALLCLPTLT